jgi:nicotinamidase/pyrazinamidase
MQRYDGKTALLVIDVQNDFADPKGSLSVAGGASLIPSINTEIGMAISAGALVVASQDWHPESTPHFQKDGGIWPVHCVGGTWGAELHPDLRLPDDALRVHKGTGGEDGYSAFTMRDPLTSEEKSPGLDVLLKERGIERVVIMGLATDYCVQASVLDAVRLGYRTAVLTDLCAPVNLKPEDGTRAEEAMRDAGVEMMQTRMR